jgi:hypothetical protein
VIRDAIIKEVVMVPAKDGLSLIVDTNVGNLAVIRYNVTTRISGDTTTVVYYPVHNFTFGFTSSVR